MRQIETVPIVVFDQQGMVCGPCASGMAKSASGNRSARLARATSFSLMACSVEGLMPSCCRRRMHLRQNVPGNARRLAGQRHQIDRHRDLPFGSAR